MESILPAPSRVSSTRYRPFSQTLTNRRLGAPTGWFTLASSDRNLSGPGPFPAAFAQTSPKPARDKFCWRDLICPFEHKFGNGDIADVRQHKSTVVRHYFLIVRRRTPRSCGASTMLCVPARRIFFRTKYTKPRSVSGRCTVPPLPLSVLSIGSTSAQHACSFLCPA